MTKWAIALQFGTRRCHQGTPDPGGEAEAMTLQEGDVRSTASRRRILFSRSATLSCAISSALHRQIASPDPGLHGSSSPGVLGKKILVTKAIGCMRVNGSAGLYHAEAPDADFVRTPEGRI